MKQADKSVVALGLLLNLSGWRKTLGVWLLLSSSLMSVNAFAQTLISISNPRPAAVNIAAVGGSQFWPNAGTVNGVPVSLRATVTSLSAGDSIRLFSSGDDVSVRANTGTLAATILWEVFDSATGLPIAADPDFLITDIDGRNGTPIESVSAACSGLTSFTVNDPTNIQTSESGGTILGEGTQNQNAGQQEGFLQFSWNNVTSWEVSYFATTRGRVFRHDADSDTPFDPNPTVTGIVEMSTVKQLAAGSLSAPLPGQQVTFEVLMSNSGPADVTGGSLVDTLPVGLTVVGTPTATAGNVSVNGQDITWTGVDVVNGGVQTLTIVAEVDAGVAPTTSLTNETTAAVTDDQLICSASNQLTSTVIVADPPAPELTVVKSIDPVTSLSAAGDTITYRYLVTNTGNVLIDSVAPTDSGPTFGPSAAAASNVLSAFSPTSASLAAGASQVFTATYLLDQVDVDNMALDPNPLLGIDNTASANGQPLDGILAPAADSTAETGFTPTASLTVVKAISAATVFDGAGDTITYQYTVTNTGDITIDSVTPTDSGPTFNGAAAAGALSAFSPVSVSLAPGDNQVFTATYVLQQADVDNMAAAADPLTAIDNTASATGDPVGPTALPAVPDSTAETGFAPAPSLTIVKSVSSLTSFSQAGDTITYEYVVDNTGNVTIDNVVPTDSGPTFNGVAGTNALSAFTPASATIEPGDPAVTFTATYVLSQQDIDNMFLSTDPTTAIDNTASATGSPSGGVLPAVPDSTAQTGFNVVAELTLVKTAGTPSIGLGVNVAATDASDTIAYTFDVTNSGDVTIDSLVVNDGGPTFNGTPGTGSLSAISCSLTVLVPGQTTSCSAIYTLSQADVDNAIIGGADAVENSANAAGEDPNGATVQSNDSPATQTIASDSSIELLKSANAPTTANGADPTIVDPGDSISYQLDIENTGNTTLSSVLVSDTIATVTCPATTDLGVSFVNDGSGQLGVGDSISCAATYVLQQIDLDNGGVQNTAQVESQDPSGAAVNDSDVVDSGFTQRTSVALLKTATPLPDPATLGAPITYTFEMTNTGNVTLSSPQVVDPICQNPAGPLTFTNGFQSGDGGVAGQMEAGETWIFECEYLIDQVDINAGEVANTATASGTPPAGSGLADPSATASNLAEAQQNAAISLIKSSSLPTVDGGSLAASTDVGDTVSYSFEIENTGNVTLDNVTVTDPLITAAPNNGTINCPAGVSSMQPGTVLTCTATYVVTQDDIDAGTIDNTANVIGQPPASIPPTDAPEADSANVVTIAPMPMLQITKSVAPLVAPLQVNDIVSYTFVIENTGNVTINDVSPLDAGPTFNGAAATNALSAFAPLTADLAPGESQSFTATYTLSQADIDSIAAANDPLTAIDNSATAEGTPANGNLPTVAPSATETGAAPNPLVDLVKTSVPPSPVVEGANITYTFRLSNTGNVTISNPVVNDARCVVPGTILNFTSGFVSGDTGATAQALDVGETWVFECTYPISQADINAGTVANAATGAGQDPAGATIDDDANVDTPLAQTSSFSVAKSTASTPSVAGDTLVYEFVVDNTGNVDISSVNVVDAKCATVPVIVSGDVGADLVLAPTEVWTLECTSIPVTQDEVNAGSVDNEVDVTGVVPPSAPLLPVAEDDLQTPIAAAPLLSVDKSASAPTTGLGSISSATDAGDTISYSFIVTNDGNVTITDLVINDPGPSFGGTAGTGVWSGLTCPVTTLAPLQSTTCTALYTLSQLDIDNAIAAGIDSVENTASAEGLDPNNGPVVSAPDTDTTTIDADSAILLLKTAAAPTIADGGDAGLTDPGDTIDFTITVENTGNTTLSNVLVTDTLIVPPNTLSCGPTTALGATFTNTGAESLAVGDSAICTATYTIDQDDINAGMVINTANVVSQDPSGAPVTEVDEATSPFTQQTSVALIKTSSPLSTNPAPQAGDLVTYTFALENTGNVTLSNAQIDDPQCENPLAPLTQSNGLNLATDENADGLLDAGETWTFNCTYAVTSDDLIAGEITNTATGSGTPPVGSGLDEPSATSSALVAAEQNAAITLEKVAGIPTVANGALPSAVDVGDTVTFTFNISNTGNLPFDNVTVDDPLITGAPNNGALTCLRSDGATNFVLGADSLEALDSITCTAVYALTQTDIDLGDVANTATAIGDPPGPIPPSPEASSSAMTPLPPQPSLSIDKSASTIPTDVIAGTIITYTYVVENTGNVTIAAVMPVDLGPTFNGVSGTNTLSDFSPLLADLAPQATQTFTATYVISQTDLDNMAAALEPTLAIDNEATADGEPENGTLPPVPPSTVETGVEPDPELELTKTSAITAPVGAGSVITYTFLMQNTGNVTISGPSVADAQCQQPASPLTFNSGFVGGDVGLIPQSLDVGETWEFTCDYVVTQSDVDAGTVQNTALGSGQDPAGETVEDRSDSGNPGDDPGGVDDPTNTPLPRVPSFAITKATLDVPAAAGESLLYTFTLTNTGNVSISTIVVSDSKCVGGVATLNPATDLGSDLILRPAGVAGAPAAEQWAFSCNSIPVTQAEIDQGFVDNTVTATGVGPNGLVVPDSSATVRTPTTQTPSMSLVKSAGLATLNNDGSFDQVFNFALRNQGNVTLTNVTITDNIPAQFGACFVAVANPGLAAFDDQLPNGDSVNFAIGSGSTLIASADALGVGDSLLVNGFTVTFNPNASDCTFPDPAQNTANGGSTQASDVSDNGSNPDLGGANDSGVPTPFTPPVAQPQLGIAKSAAILAFNADSTFDVEYTVLMQNTGDVDLTSISLFDDISAQAGSAFTPSTAAIPSSGVISAPVVSLVTDAPPIGAVLPSLNSSYAGAAQNIMTGSSGALGVGDVIEVRFSIRLDPSALNPVPDSFENVASGSANGPDGQAVADDSNDGTDPSVGAGGDSSPTIVALEDVASLPIVLGQFSSSLTTEGIFVQWQTQTEVSNLGFNLYGKVGDEWQLLNPAMVPGRGDSVEVVDYQYLITRAVDVIALSDVDGRGEETLHGPFMVGQTYGKAPQRQSTDWSEAIERRNAKQQLREQKRRAEMLERNRQRQQEQQRSRVGG